jgi:hypothetical protein
LDWLPGDFDVFIRNVNVNFGSGVHARIGATGKPRVITVTNSFIIQKRDRSLTTFNILFKNKDDQFRTSAWVSTVDKTND